MTNKNKLAYVTYQSYPAETANSLQSITNIVELAKQGIDADQLETQMTHEEKV